MADTHYPCDVQYYEMAADNVKRSVGALSELCRDSGAPEWLLASRVKKLTSIVDKLRKKRETKRSYTVEMMTDIAGVRCIVESVATAKALAALLRTKKPFEIDEDNSKDYAEAPRADGYRGIHLIFRVTVKLTKTEVIPVELQIRTILQHQWSVLSHSEFYKSIDDIPPALLVRMRAFSEILNCAEIESEDLRRTRILDETHGRLWDVLRSQVIEKLSKTQSKRAAAVGLLANRVVEFEKQLRRTLVSSGSEQRLANRALAQLRDEIYEMSLPVGEVVVEITDRVRPFIAPLRST